MTLQQEPDLPPPKGWADPAATWMHKALRMAGGSPSVSTWASFLVRALPLAVLPYFVFGHFSDAEAALWFVLITLQGLQLLLESSIGLTLIRTIGFAIGGAAQVRDQSVPDAGRVAGANVSLLSRIWVVTGRLYGAVGLLTFVLIGWAGLASTAVLADQLPRPVDGLMALGVFVVGAAARAYGGRHIGFLFAVGRIAALRWWEMFFWGLSFLMAVAAIQAGAGLFWTAAAYQAPLIANLAWNVMLSRRDQAARTGFERNGSYDNTVLAEIWPSMWRTSLGVLLFLGVTQGAGLYFATFGDAQSVAIYLFAMSVMRPMMQFAQVPFFTKLPRLAAMQAAGRREEQIRLAARGMRFSHLLLAGMILAAAAGFWLQARFAPGALPATVPPSLWAWVGLAATLERVGASHLQLHSLTNRIVVHWANGGAALLFVLFSGLLLPRYGALGFPAALCLAAALFYVPFSMWHSYKTFGLEFPDFEMQTSIVAVSSVLLLVMVSV